MHHQQGQLPLLPLHQPPRPQVVLLAMVVVVVMLLSLPPPLMLQQLVLRAHMHLLGGLNW